MNKRSRQNLMQGRAVAARLAHNQEVMGSNPIPATISGCGYPGHPQISAFPPRHLGVGTEHAGVHFFCLFRGLCPARAKPQHFGGVPVSGARPAFAAAI